MQAAEQKREISKLKAQGKKAMEMNDGLNRTVDHLLQTKRSLEEKVRSKHRCIAT